MLYIRNFFLKNSAKSAKSSPPFVYTGFMALQSYAKTPQKKSAKVRKRNKRSIPMNFKQLSSLRKNERENPKPVSKSEKERKRLSIP